MTKRIWIVCVIVCVVFSCCACKKDAAPATTQPPATPTVSGSWNAQVDITEHINQMLKSQMGIDHLSSSFSVVLCLTLAEDGTYTLTYDREHLSSQLDIMGNVLWQFVVDQAAAQSGLTTEEASNALHEQGKSRQVLVSELKLETFFDNSFHKTGFWKHENSKLFTAEAENSFTVEATVDAQLMDNQLTLSYQAGVDDEENPIYKTVVFNRTL